MEPIAEIEQAIKDDWLRYARQDFLFFREGRMTMSISSILPVRRDGAGPDFNRLRGRGRKGVPPPLSFRFPAQGMEMEAQNRHAELFYLQKQIQAQTPMVIVLEDGERVEGCIEWYDRNALKVRGHIRMLIYKSAIKYMYKLGDTGPQ
jgi:sRNA-binding regulator protein Hfq